MAYIRRRGNQVVIVHGVREPETGKVQQQTLFTLYTKAEAREAIGKESPRGEGRFRSYLKHQHPTIRFDWEKIRTGIEENIDVLPDNHPYREERVIGGFRRDLCALSRRLILADPQCLHSAAQLVSEHRHELEFLTDLIQWRLRVCDQEENEWNTDNPFFWRFELRGRDAPPEAHERAVTIYENGDLDRAESVFRLLVDCFDDYADGYNYLGLIALDRDDLAGAIEQFRRAVEIGRRLFPKRIARQDYWNNIKTRPFVRGLRNLALAYNRAERYDEALALCDRLETECDDQPQVNSSGH